MTKLSLNEAKLKRVYSNLQTENKKYTKYYPGDSGLRQPVHTVYGGAHLFSADTTKKLGELSLNGFLQYVESGKDLKENLQINVDSTLMDKVFDRVRNKLENEAVEDFRIDFEDGFGVRPDPEEDEVAIRASSELIKSIENESLPPFIGIRIKPLTEEFKKRSFRTLDLFLTKLCMESELPSNFVVTLPKIVHTKQVKALCEVFDLLEKQLRLKKNTLKMEFMIETPQSILTNDGSTALPEFLEQANDRCVAAHFGTYDYTASVNITAEYQQMDHPACDFARSFMKVLLAGTGIWLSDGATNIMPVGPHRGKNISKTQLEENKEAIFKAWRLSYSHIRHSLKNAFYQGWDLHPLQFPIRYIAIYLFFIEGLTQNSTRLKNFMDQAAKATLSGEIFDDAATGQGLLNYFLRALNCGAITLDEVLATGLTLEEIQTKSFAKILKGRKKI